MRFRFVHLLIVSAAILSLSAAYFSVTGLAKLFSGSFVAVIVMTSCLELTKLIVASYLYRYWKKISRSFRVYLTLAVIILMVITSAGIYGFLSSAYSVTASKLGDVNSKIELLEKKRDVLKEEEKQISLMISNKSERVSKLTDIRSQQETRIDTLYSRKMFGGVRKTEQVIKNADVEISKLGEQIDILSNKAQVRSDSIGVINVRILELQSSDINVEIGPLKYIAQLTGKNIDQVVNFFIFLLIFVFDPLAVCLVVAINNILLSEKGKDNPSRIDKLSYMKDKEVLGWKEDDNHHLLIDYDLNEDSIIFDIGGYEGEWSQEMYDKYGCNIYIFEPVKENYNFIVNRFKGKDKVKVFNFALLDETGKFNISVNQNMSSFYLNQTNVMQTVSVVSILDFLNKNVEVANKKIDVMKINAEGSEYPLLLSLLNSLEHKSIINYQVQFHKFIFDHRELYDKIKTLFLENGYEHTYCFPFTWENFRKNENS